MPHLRRRSLLPLLGAFLALLSTAPPVGAQEQGYADLGCYRDAEGDVDEPRGDIEEYCLSFFGSFPRFIVDPVEPVDPSTDTGWQDPATAAELLLSTDGDAMADYVVRLTFPGGEGLVEVLEVATGDVCEGDGGAYNAQVGVYIGDFSGACIGDADTVASSAALAYADGGPAVRDEAAPEGTSPVLTNAFPPPDQCEDAAEDDAGGVVILRIRCGGGGTEPITQAVAVSEFVFGTIGDPGRRGARWAVLARNDDFADALAGSALGFGQGPLLFTHSPASAPPGVDPALLANETRRELVRTLPRGSTVYLLGGEAALHAGLDDDLRGLGYVPVRYGGLGREETAAIISAEVRRLVEGFVEDNDFPDTRSVLVTTRANWPDAVVAGSVAAYWGMPILLTPTDFLHPATIAALEEMQPEFIYVIGGSAVVAREVLAELQQYATGGPSGSFCDVADDPATPEDETRTFQACRWAGPERIVTAQAVGELNRALLARYEDNGLGNLPADAVYAAAINMFRPDSFAHTLSASAVSGRFGGALFIPLAGDGGESINEGIESWLCNFLPDMDFLLLMGDVDLVKDEAAQMIRTTIEDGCSA